MIGTAQFVNDLWVGIVLIALGLLPALLETFTHSVQEFPRRFLLAPIPSRWLARRRHIPVKQQPWLAALGAAIIAATFFLYFGT